MEIVQYNVVLVNLNIAADQGDIGAEIRKIRPCVVISPDEMNSYLRTVVVAPMTTRSRIIPTRVRIRHNRKTGYIVVDRIRSVDRNRIVRRLGKLTQAEIRKLKRVIQETYVD